MTKIHHAHLYGIRANKYDWLSNHDLSSTDWQEIQSQEPFYLLIPQNTDLLNEHEQAWKITEAMPVNSVGIVTARDKLTIHWTEEDVWETVKDFSTLDSEVAREKYGLRQDSSDWKITSAQLDLRKSGLSKKNIVKILYRPFDIRYTYYTGNSGGFHCRARGGVMKNMVSVSNFSFICTRQTRDEWSVLASSSVIGHKALAAYDISSLIPLYLDRNEITKERSPNFSSEFFQAIKAKVGITPTPDDIFYYIYAIFYSPTYRSRYAEFLKTDFPRIPLTSDCVLFRSLASYGEALVNLHLMRASGLEDLITRFEEHTDRTVSPGHPKYTNGKVIINKQGDGFAGVPEEVWNLYVGGYQVCRKWLQDRKGRTLSDDDILHYQRVVVALKETITIMKNIDEVIPSWPIE